MVDFSKRLKKKEIIKKTNPVEIYDSLDRRSEAGPLRDSQEKIVNEWYSKHKDLKDNIIKLHTGEGKTLIGLLLLQSKLNEVNGPSIFVCPNVYLAEQVKLEAAKFGIPYCEFDSGGELPDSFVSGQKILITHVQKVFNGRTKFGINNKSQPINAIVLDDSHACIDSIKSSLTIKLNNDHDLYKEILDIFREDIAEQGEGSFIDIENGEGNTMLPIPYWSWKDKKDSVIRSISRHQQDRNIFFAWPVIKDNLSHCQAFISGKGLEISPTLMPIEAFGSFSKANHRILMSATTQDDSFFIKGLGFNISSVKNPLTNNELKWSGEKMILIPSLIDDSLGRETIINWIMKNHANRRFGIVSLTPSFSTKLQYENIGAHVATTEDLFDSVQNLKKGNCDKAIVFANRYDGIDLPDDACRLLIIDSKPYFDSLVDRYEEDCRPTSDIINIRIAQKVEQGLGRSVRSEKDYSVILIIGGDLVKFIKSPLTSKYFSQQTKKQIEIGKQIAEFAKEEKSESEASQAFVDLVNQSFNRDEGWKEYYSEEMNASHHTEEENKVYEILDLEYKAEKLYQLGEYDRACTLIQKILDSYVSCQMESGWYLQIMSRYKYSISKAESASLQKTAFHKNNQLLKPKEGVVYNKLHYVNQSRIERIKNWISKFETYEDLLIGVDGFLQDLSFGQGGSKL
ncbi:DEAD/DEAH box helicase [Enterovibrio norvegicus]|uniref:DEAD/DEAH box helicase n=1 Tax=Enterovibrio norvegicus TaxID=188144 RepID=UPI0024B1EFCA|nr:DEAD/DEAH box helicase family protein [Enterovibrio norvegicus]